MYFGIKTMFRFVLVALFFGACVCNVTVKPGVTTSTESSVRCGEIPNQVYKCLGNPKIIKSEVSNKCDRSISECDRMKCVFKRMGWLKGDNIDKLSITHHFTQFARENPDWTPATIQIKEQCLNQELLPQGIYLGCPMYDLMQCILTAFLRQAKPSQWTASADCEQAKAFAAACPACPGDCFAAAIPIGSCNACLIWPKKP